MYILVYYHTRVIYGSYPYHHTIKKHPLECHIARINIGITVTNPFIIKHRRLRGQDPEVMNTSADSYTPTMNRRRNYSISAEFISANQEKSKGCLPVRIRQPSFLLIQALCHFYYFFRQSIGCRFIFRLGVDADDRFGV